MSWLNPFSWFTGSGNTQNQGAQTSSPASYSSSPAANVTFDTAMNVSAFWACARLISETVAAMPIKCYRVSADGSREQDRSYHLWRLLNYNPNRYQTKTEFYETLMLNLVTNGNSFCFIKRVNGRIVSLVPLMSAQMRVELQENGSKKFIYRTHDNRLVEYKSSQIWHVMLFGNGIVGMSPLAYARQSLGVSIATDKRVSKLAENGGKVSGLLSTDKPVSPEQRKMFRENISSNFIANKDSIMVLEAGLKYQQVGLSPQDLEMLKSRRFQVEDIARFMGVPSVLINDTAGSTVWGSGVEQLIGGFYKLNTKPYLERIESSKIRHLVPREDWGIIEIEFDFDSLLRADRKTRTEANSSAINSGQMTPNEARRDEGLKPIAGGDSIYINGSLRDPSQPQILPNPIKKETQNEND